MPKTKTSKTKWLDDIAFYALRILKENGGMSPSAIMEAVEGDKKTRDLIPSEAREVNPGNQIPKWENRLHLRSVLFVKAGLLYKNDGIWSLSDKGLATVKKGIDYVNEEANKIDKELSRAYQEKLKANRKNLRSSATQQNQNVADSDEASALEENIVADYKKTSLDDEEEKAREDIEEYILNKIDWKQFQDLCAALLRGMGYHVSYVAPPGPDGGVDVLAYIDPIGSKQPRIKLQSKQFKSKIDLSVVTKLEKSLTEGDIGIIVTASSFSSESRRHCSNIEKHIELIDLTRFIKLWREHYDKMPEKDKALLPLRPIYFLDKDKVSK